MSPREEARVGWAALLRERRREHGLSREALAIRSGRAVAQLAAFEDGREELTHEDLASFLCALGEELTADAADCPGARPRSHPFDPGQIARQAALPIERRVELALAWNDFAYQLSHGRHDPAPPQQRQ